MATITVNRPDIFGPATEVDAHVDHGHDRHPLTGAPAGAVAGEGVVAEDGILTIGGLPPNADFVLRAAEPDRYMRATTRGQSGGEGGTAVVDSGEASVIAPARAGRKSVIVQNADVANTLYVGLEEAVDAGTGLVLEPGESVSLPVSGPVWGLASGDGTDVRFVEFF